MSAPINRFHLLALAALLALPACTRSDPTAALSSGLVPRGEISGGLEPMGGPPTLSAGMPVSDTMATGSTQAMAPTQVAALAPAPSPAGAMVGDVQFLPVVGAPPAKAELLAGALSRNAAARGIAIRPAAGPVAALRLKGYFSTLTEGRRTMLVYVWDVLDSSGARLTRISGQEPASGAGGSDPWSAIGPQTIDAVAARTLTEAAGLLSRQG